MSSKDFLCVLARPPFCLFQHPGPKSPSIIISSHLKSIKCSKTVVKRLDCHRLERKGWFTLRHKHKHRNKHKNFIATAQAYLHFAHVYLHSIIQDGGPRRRGRISRNWDFASSFATTRQKSKESTNIKKEIYQFAKFIL